MYEAQPFFLFFFFFALFLVDILFLEILTKADLCQISPAL